MLQQKNSDMESSLGSPDMENSAQLGGHPQQLERNFSLVSMLALSVSLMASWEAISSTMAAGLVSGGPVSLVYGAIVAFLGTLCSALSLAELASAYPTAGGQYHFVAELSPKRFRVLSSWFSGYISVFGWQAVAASAPFLAGTMIQGLLVLNYSPDSYTFERWHGTLLYWAILAFAALANIYGSRLLPMIENMTLALHVILFFVILIVMAVVSPMKNTAKFVFTDFENQSGWSSDGVAWCIGLLSSCYVLIGYDGATHLSEEMQNPAVGVPYAMVGSVVINAVMGFAFLLTILFCMGDITTALGTSTGFPIIQIFYGITGNLHAASAMTCAIIVMAILATIPLMSSAARMTWAFARDGGLPFARHLSKVEKKRSIPTTSILATTFFLALLGLINIGSTSAFNAILSLATVGLQISYLMPIILLLWRRARSPSTLLYGPFQLGKAGFSINIVAVLYLTFTCIFLLFPPYQPVTPQNMNYASLVLGVVLVFSIFYWIWRGGKRYSGPIIELESFPRLEVLQNGVFMQSETVSSSAKKA